MKRRILAAAMGLAALTAAAPARADACFLGQIKLFAGEYAPRGYAFADGSELQIRDGYSLFDVIGTTFGGDGTTTFRLPDLRGRFARGAGQGPGLQEVQLGETGGTESVRPDQTDVAAGTDIQVAEPGPIALLPPASGINYIICTRGLYPQR